MPCSAHRRRAQRQPGPGQAAGLPAEPRHQVRRAGWAGAGWPARMRGARSWSRAIQLVLVLLRITRARVSSGISARPPHLATRSPHPTHATPPARPLRRRHGEAAALAEGLMELMDNDRDGSAAFPDFLRVGGWACLAEEGCRAAAGTLVHCSCTPPLLHPAQPPPAARSLPSPCSATTSSWPAPWQTCSRPASGGAPTAACEQRAPAAPIATPVRPPPGRTRRNPCRLRVRA